MSTKPSDVLQIRKYPNRRYYDATRSCHVTLNELYDLVRGGHTVRITESRDGEDITNLVLLQILLDRDQPKLDVFPAALFHQVIRTNLPALRASVDRFFGPLTQLMASSHQQFDSFLKQAFSTQMPNPMDWTKSMFEMMSAPARNEASDRQPESAVDEAEPAEPAARQEPGPVPPPPEAPPASDQTLDEMRRQISELNTRLEQLSSRSSNQEH